MLRSVCLGGCRGSVGVSLELEEVEEAVEGVSASDEPVGWRRRPPMAGGAVSEMEAAQSVEVSSVSSSQ